jgi:hypothetical protein
LLALSGISVLAEDLSVAPAFKPDASPLVRLEAKNGQTHFQLGDLIPLELVFADPGFVPTPEAQKLTPIQRAMQVAHPLPGQHTVNSIDYGDLADTITITPSAGWFQWQGKSGHDYSSSEQLTEHEIRVPLVLNQGFVFREPGHYEVSVTTFRLDGKPATTNPIGLDLTARPAEEELALVRRLNAQIVNPSSGSNSCPCERGNPAAEQLAALPGDDAVRAKAHWLVAEGDDLDDARQAITRAGRLGQLRVTVAASRRRLARPAAHS